MCKQGVIDANIELMIVHRCTDTHGGKKHLHLTRRANPPWEGVDDQPAQPYGDIFTKELEIHKFLRAVGMLGMSEPDLADQEKGEVARAILR